MQRRGAVPFVVRLDRDAHVQHQPDRDGVTCLRGGHDRGSLLGGELSGQLRMFGHQARCGLTVAVTTGAEQPVDSRAVVAGAVAAQQLGDVFTIQRRRKPVGRAAVRTRRHDISPV